MVRFVILALLVGLVLWLLFGRSRKRAVEDNAADGSTNQCRSPCARIAACICR